MQPLEAMTNYCDSLSCLHALEHFGLGRYGDPVDPDSYRAGLANMARVLSPGGTFYLAVPVGQPRVEFNANRVFDPADILSQCRGLGLELRELNMHTATRRLQRIEPTPPNLDAVAAASYGLGLFVFGKN